MKKLMVLILVLAITPMASAVPVLTWSVTGNTGPGAMDVEAGDVVTATLSLSGGLSAGLSIGVITDQSVGGDMTDSSISAGYDSMHFDGWTNVEAAAMGMTGTYGIGDAVYLVGSIAGGSNKVSGTLITLYYTVDSAATAPSTITIIAQAGEGGSSNTIDVDSANVVMPNLVLNVVPEPMTIALLGLGGLFLRRRK